VYSLYKDNDIANTSDTNVSISLHSVMLNPIAALLVSIISVVSFTDLVIILIV
tara:strand:+ start:3657 stop:3815 length:159 start_codon:yes stop_codon:yes gene_type:complete